MPVVSGLDVVREMQEPIALAFVEPGTSNTGCDEFRIGAPQRLEVEQVVGSKRRDGSDHAAPRHILHENGADDHLGVGFGGPPS